MRNLFGPVVMVGCILALMGLLAVSPPADGFQWLRAVMGGLLLLVLALAAAGLRHMGRRSVPES